MYIGINSPNGCIMLNLDQLTSVFYDKSTKLITITTTNSSQVITIEDGSGVYNRIADKMGLDKIYD